MRINIGKTLYTVILCLCISQCLSAEDNPFNKVISLNAWGKSVSYALNQINEKSKVNIRPSKYLLTPKEMKEKKIYLKADAITVRQAVEWMARALECKYRIKDSRNVILTGDYSFILDERQKLKIFVVDNLIDIEGKTLLFENNLSEMTKLISLFDKSSQFCSRIEDQGPEIKAVTILPETLSLLINQAINSMNNPGRKVIPSAVGSQPKAAVELNQNLNAQSIVARLENRPALEAIGDISLQSGIYICLDHAPYAKKKIPLVTLDLRSVETRTIIEKLGEQLGYRGYEMMLPNTVWMTTKKRKWTLASSREILWKQLRVESYSVPAISKMFGGGNALPHHIRTNISIDTWLDPSASVIYHARSGNLIVIAPENVQNQIYNELARIKLEVLRRAKKKSNKE